MTLQELLEALKPSQYRPLVKLQKEKYSELPEEIFAIHQAIFGDESRIYFTLDGEPEHFIKGSGPSTEKKGNVTKIDKLIKEVNTALAGAGYIVDDINNNKAYKFLDLNTDKGKMIWSKIPEANKQDATQYSVMGHIVYIKKNEFSIIKLLAAHPELQKEYEAYYQKVQSKNKKADSKMSDNPDDYLIVVSRHAYDIGGASTGRQWRSCMNLDDGVNRRYIKYDVAGGNAVSYLIKKDDINITNPYARVLIKKYKTRGKEGHYCLFPEQTCYSELYSPIIDKYKEIIQSIIVKAQKETFEPDLIYKFVKTKQYEDNSTKPELFINKEGGTGVTEEDQKIIRDIVNKFNEDVKKVAEDKIGNLSSNKIIKNAEYDISDEINQYLDDKFSDTGGLDLTKDGSMYIRLIKSGFKNDNSWETPESIRKFSMNFAKNLNNTNAKVEYSEIQQNKKENKNDILVRVYNIDPDAFGYNSPVVIERKYDVSHIEMNNDYKKTLVSYIEELDKKGLGLSAKINNKRQLELDMPVNFYIRVKNPALAFVEWMENKKGDKKIKISGEIVAAFYRFKQDGNAERRDWEENTGDDFDDAMEELGMELFHLLPFNRWDSDGNMEMICDWIAKRINSGKYNFDDFITMDENKKKPVAEVLKDFYKSKGFDENKPSTFVLRNFANEAQNIVEMDETDDTAFNKQYNFYNKMIESMYGAKSEKSPYYKNTIEMFEKEILNKDDLAVMRAISKAWSGADLDDKERDKAMELIKKFYTKYRAYSASKKKNKVNKKPETKIVKENIDLIKSKISRLKRFV